MTSKGDDGRSGIEKAREEAGDALNQTIVTGRKIVIDKETGEIRFEEVGASKASAPVPEKASETSSVAGPEPDVVSSGAVAETASSALRPGVASPPVHPGADEEDLESTMARQAPLSPEQIAAAEEAAREANERSAQPAPPPVEEDMEKTMAQPGPVVGGELAGTEEVTEQQAAPVVGDMVMTKANKRLSAETLFAFALPEPVINEAIAKAKADAEAKSEAQPLKTKSSKLPLVMGLMVLVGGIAAALLYLSLEDSDGERAISLSQNAAPVEDTEQAIQTDETSAPQAEDASLPSGSLNDEELENLSNAQLMTALNSDDFSLVASALPIAAKRKDPALVKKLIELGSHKDYLIRVNVVKALSDRSIYTDETADQVLALLLARIDDKDEIVRGFAAKAIGATGDKTALTKLRGRLDQEDSEVVSKMIRAAIIELEAAG